MITVLPHPEGCVLPVRAQPGARRNEIVGEQGGSLKVSVTAAPEDGKANKALLALLRNALGLKRSQIELLGEAASRDKKFLVRELSAEALRELLGGILQ